MCLHNARCCEEEMAWFASCLGRRVARGAVLCVREWTSLFPTGCLQSRTPLLAGSSFPLDQGRTRLKVRRGACIALTMSSCDLRNSFQALSWWSAGVAHHPANLRKRMGPLTSLRSPTWTASPFCVTSSSPLLLIAHAASLTACMAARQSSQPSTASSSDVNPRATSEGQHVFGGSRVASMADILVWSRVFCMSDK